MKYKQIPLVRSPQWSLSYLSYGQRGGHEHTWLNNPCQNHNDPQMAVRTVDASSWLQSKIKTAAGFYRSIAKVKASRSQEVSWSTGWLLKECQNSYAHLLIFLLCFKLLERKTKLTTTGAIVIPREIYIWVLNFVYSSCWVSNSL